MKFFKLFIFFIHCIGSGACLAYDCNEIQQIVNQCDKTFKHNIQLQLYDANGVPVYGTEFWVTLNIVKKRACCDYSIAEY